MKFSILMLKNSLCIMHGKVFVMIFFIPYTVQYHENISMKSIRLGKLVLVLAKMMKISEIFECMLLVFLCG